MGNALVREPQATGPCTITMEDGIHSPQSDAESLDMTFALLGNRRRRHVVDLLWRRESPIELTELARALAAWETARDEVPAKSVEDVAVVLHHCHLPRLDEADVIDYDPESNTVRPRKTEKLAPFFDPTVAAQ